MIELNHFIYTVSSLIRIVAAGSVVTPGQHFPPHSMIMGIPAKRVRALTEEEQERIRLTAGKYVQYAKDYREQMAQGRIEKEL